MNETRHREVVEHGRAWWTWALIGIGALGALALLAAAYVAFTGATAEKERDESEQEKAAIAAPANESASKILELCKKDNRVAMVLRREGVCGTSAEVRKEIRIQVMEGPEGPPGAAGPRGEQGPGPTEAQVLFAVQQYCEAQPGGSCEGPGPTRAEVRAAVIAYCADGRCRGDQGVEGPQGEQGVQGAQGAQGPPPSDTQVDAAVERYCDADGDGVADRCRGPQGPQGEQGPRGYQVAKVEFEPYEDGTKCRVVFTLNDPEDTRITTDVPRSFCASNEGAGAGPP